MPRTGRLLGEQMRDKARETPERVAERIRARRAAELAIADREAKYPELTPENAREAITYQAAQLLAHYMDLEVK